MSHFPVQKSAFVRGQSGLTALASGVDRDAANEGVWSWVFHLDRLAQAGVMAGGLAHDARNLLAGISGTCELALLRGDMGDSKETLNRINSLALQAAEAMSVFLTFARRGDVVPRPCRVADVAQDALSVLHPTICKSRADVTLDIEPGLRVHGERTLLLQALVNLVLNALKAFGTNPGHVVIRAHRDGADAVLEVADDGPGIPDDVLPRLFRPFGTASSSSSEGGGGTGLGLFITRRILEQQGGTIEVDSCRDSGTTFRIQLKAVAVTDPRSACREMPQ